MATEIKLGKMGSFELNPRGNIWFKDDTTFGHKLLSKMGWSKGKGLGKNEDGITENIKILKKDNLAGVGYKNDSFISVGCIEYESILKKLQQHFKNKGSYSTTNLESLEKRSRSSKSRLHYRKFIKGKDLFQCSEKDMKCIFLENPQYLGESYLKDTIDEEITTVKSELSISDYFAQKMQQKKIICSKAEDVAENVTFEKSCETLSTKQKIVKRIEVQKKANSDCDEYLNKSSSLKRKKCNLNSPKVMFPYKNKKIKSEFGMNTNNNKEKENEMSRKSSIIISKLSNGEISKNEIKKATESDEKEQTPARISYSDSVNVPECLGLPVCSASSYNCWLESQRTALKMKLYQNMIKKLKRHHILSTTNLLDIRGYGNWDIK